ncbi:unnamed protein product [Orchesella dallaii]|uniref:Uncharacterized protein n=1 Tax=Orchesella dallaii TaxID=48710 RepID=A0ABP1S7Y9_9HEXA
MCTRFRKLVRRLFCGGWCSGSENPGDNEAEEELKQLQDMKEDNALPGPQEIAETVPSSSSAAGAVNEPQLEKKTEAVEVYNFVHNRTATFNEIRDLRSASDDRKKNIYGYEFSPPYLDTI